MKKAKILLGVICTHTHISEPDVVINYEVSMHDVCYILCRQRVFKIQLDEADKLLMMFYAEVVRLYGNSGCNIV